MIDNIFSSIFETTQTTTTTVSDFLLCVGTALLSGLIMAFAYMFKTRYTKSFVVTLAILPAVVCVVIMTVNGNIGAGVAVAGAFNLVRFRSVPGSAREICAIFLTMAAGLIAGMGYIAHTLLYTVVLSVVFTLYNLLDLGTSKKTSEFKNIRITIPESLDYTGVFDEIFDKYTKSYELISVKTTNMGSMFKLSYDIVLKDSAKEKEFIDEIRCRNGNLEINISRQAMNNSEL